MGSQDKEAGKWIAAIESEEIKEEGLIKSSNEVRARKRAEEVLLSSRYHDDEGEYVLPELVGRKELQPKREFKHEPQVKVLAFAESEWNAGRLAQLMWKYYNHDFGLVCKQNHGEYGSSMPVIQAN